MFPGTLTEFSSLGDFSEANWEGGGVLIHFVEFLRALPCAVNCLMVEALMQAGTFSRIRLLLPSFATCTVVWAETN